MNLNINIMSQRAIHVDTADDGPKVLNSMWWGVRSPHESFHTMLSMEVVRRANIFGGGKTLLKFFGPAGIYCVTRLKRWPRSGSMHAIAGLC